MNLSGWCENVVSDRERLGPPQNAAFKASSQLCLEIDTLFLIKNHFPTMLRMFCVEIIPVTMKEACPGDSDLGMTQTCKEGHAAF